MRGFGWLFWLLLVGSPAFAQESTPPAVADEGVGATVGPEVESYLRARFARARELFDDRLYEHAFRLADSILRVSPDVSFAEELKRFKRTAQGRYVSGGVLTVTFEPDLGLEFPRRALKGTLRLANVSSAAVAIGKRRRSTLIGQARFQITEIYEDGTEWSTIGTRAIRVPKGFALGEGQSHEIAIDFPYPEGPRQPLIQIVDLHGHLIPTELILGKEKLQRAVPWMDHRATWVPKELAAARDEPSLQLQVGILTGDYRRTLVAGVIAIRRLRKAEQGGDNRPKEREQITTLLLDSLETKDPRMQYEVQFLLRELTGLPFRSVREWREWAKAGEEPADRKTRANSRDGERR